MVVERIGVVCQTSLDYEDAKRMVAELRREYVVEGVVELCAASRERQTAVRAFDGDALLVLGSRSSANTRRLCEVAKCTALVASNMEEVESASARLRRLGKVGVKSGASTPERFYDSAVKFLEAIDCA